MPSPRQNGTAPGTPGAGRDDHAVAGDVLDPPGGGAEQEGLALARLVDHLLVELADPAAVGQVHAVEAAVGDRPGIGDRELAGALASANGAGGALPDDPRPELGEALGRVAPVEHVQDVLELLAPEIGKRLGRSDDLEDLVDRPLLVGDHRDDVLRQHVERVSRDDRLLDQPLAHAARDDRALQEVGSELREDAALRDVAQVVAGAADALEAARHRLRRLDLDHEVHGAHVDAELERRGRDQAWKLAALQHLLDDQALLMGERAVVGARDLDRPLRSLVVGVSGLLGRRQLLLGLLVRQLVEPLGQALGAAAVVDEQDRRGVRLDELEQLRVHRRPDRVLSGRRVEVGIGELRLAVLRRSGPRCVRVRHVLDRNDDLQVELLADAGVDDGALALRADQEVGDALERALRRREADALDRRVGAAAVLVSADQMVEPLQGQREVRAALGCRDGVDLVDDHGLDVREDLVRPRGHHQIERLGRRDQDVRRLAEHRLAVLLRRVAGAKADLDRRADALERRAQVAIHVVRERLERRDVDQANALAERLGVLGRGVRIGRCAPRELVDPPQERRERLARAGGRADQRVVA